MATAALNFQKVQKNVHSKINSIDLPSVNWKTVCILGFAMCLALLVFYVLQVNDLTRGSYLISNYQRQIGTLSQANKNLEVSFAENSFLGQAVEKIQALNFQKTVSVKYIQIPSSSVAMAVKK